MNTGKTEEVHVGEMKAKERTETGTPRVREVGKYEGNSCLHAQRWEEGIHVGKSQESQEREECA